MENRTSSKTAGVLALALVAGCLTVLGFLLWRSFQDQSSKRAAAAPPPVRASAPPAPPRPTEAAPTPILAGRAELLTAAADAAAAHAAGTPAESGPPGALTGRRFRLRLPFGCGGPSTIEPASGSYFSIDPQAQTLRVVVRPEIWTGSPLVTAPAEKPQPEAVAGFWISRPWLRSEACPAAGGDPLAAETGQPSPESVGLALFYEAGGSRAAGGDTRAYETVVNLQPGQARLRTGLKLVLEGRVTGFDNAAFRCRSAHPDQRPVCIARVQIDSLAVEIPGERTPIATWEIGSVSPAAR